MTTLAPRITARINQDTQVILTKAAALAGISSINSFVLSAAIEKAKEIINKEMCVNINLEDSQMLITALDNPAQANQYLQNAEQNYNAHNQNKI